MEKSIMYDYFDDCWINGYITTKGMYAAVHLDLITEEERIEIMKQPRGDTVPDVPWGETS